VWRDWRASPIHDFHYVDFLCASAPLWFKILGGKTGPGIVIFVSSRYWKPMQDMKVVFVHGWSVTDTGAYGGVPEALLKNAPSGLRLDIAHLFLGKSSMTT
jgi:hypothetical protein